MSWVLYRWVWQLEGPLFIGKPPAGSLNRTRLYMPARAIWGAVTAELARAEGTDGTMPDYETTGNEIAEQTRLSYLYPAELQAEAWSNWLPNYEASRGLHWVSSDEYKSPVEDLHFRYCLLSTRPGTAIDPDTDSAAEKSLRETECLQQNWKNAKIGGESPTAMLGYIFIRDTIMKERIEKLKTLFVGGDTRYGLGRLLKVAWEEVSMMFGKTAQLEGLEPTIESDQVFAHAEVGGLAFLGDRERLNGWEFGQSGVSPMSNVLWVPGSKSTTSYSWKLEKKNGFWARSA